MNLEPSTIDQVAAVSTSLHNRLDGVHDKLDKILDRLQVGPKTVRVLAIPNKDLAMVISIIRRGLMTMRAVGKWTPEESKEACELLSKWCVEQEAYLERT